MANLRGKWTVPGKPLPSSHLLTASRRVGARHRDHLPTRCGILESLDGVDWSLPDQAPTDDPPAGRTCELCLKWSRRDS